MAIRIRYLKFQFKAPPQISENEYNLAKLQLHNMNQTYDPKPILGFKNSHRQTYKLLKYTLVLICISVGLALIVPMLPKNLKEVFDVGSGVLLMILSIALIGQLFSLKTSYQSFRVYKSNHKNFYQFVQRIIRASNSYEEYLQLYKTEGKKVWIEEF